MFGLTPAATLPPCHTPPLSGDAGRTTAEAELHQARRKYAQLHEEFQTYRQRAMQLLREKEQQIERLAGAADSRPDPVPATTPTAAAPSPRAPASGGVSVMGSTVMGPGYAWDAQKEYLKHVLLKYFKSVDPGVKQQLETAVATVMEFSPSDLEAIQQQRAAQTSGGVWSWLGAAQ